VQLGVGKEVRLDGPEQGVRDGAGLPSDELGHDAEDADAGDDDGRHPAAVGEVNGARHVLLGLCSLFHKQQCAGMKDTHVSCSSLQYRIYFAPNLYF
jgi:hypothetical protein